LRISSEMETCSMSDGPEWASLSCGVSVTELIRVDKGLFQS
jgi:hypothetical protein